MNINFAISKGLCVFVLPSLRLTGILNLLFNFFPPTVKISKDINNLCMICLDDKNDNDLFKSCRNNHFYHKKCINQWVDISTDIQKCPECCQDLQINIDERKHFFHI